MIRDRDGKIFKIIETIAGGLRKIEDPNEVGPSLYFYKRVMDLRRAYNSVADFLQDDSNIELLYATLVSWDMDSRGAKMLYFDDFRENLLSCCGHFSFLENYQVNDDEDWNEYLSMICEMYEHLHVMRTKKRLVSNSKLFHFLLPEQFMPMDGRNTLEYLYKNNHESATRYLEIFEFMHDILDILNTNHEPDQYLDDMTNQSVPKLIDNAVMAIPKD